MEKQATLKEKFSVFGSRTAGRPIRCVAVDDGSRSALSKAEFMEKVRQSNEACQRGDFQEAVHLYGDALQADPQNCILYSNRSAAFLKLGQHQAALEDAEKACGLNPKWPKGFILLSASYCVALFHLGAKRVSGPETWMSPDLAEPGSAAGSRSIPIGGDEESSAH
ncbi:PREDICTED: tetratricopeptide repeat protein 28-like isoform X2 [Poecilia mexicana]|uniref:tetratricopeptide repeat protein 28-like isoform X2 n=1 Tax=Poecilia mexicana TaxID=48701 RepID=UPI00072E35A4|nr:PREDICTED: tetratricopeptide repeat protein 28-like isoform X2 [Poecilia mexicana]